MSLMGTSKLDRLVHYVCAKCENPYQLGATKLNKILWYSDVLSFANEGSAITGATYVKRQFGPVPKDIMASRARLQADGSIIERKVPFHAYNQTQFIAIKPADISMFTADQISLVDTVLHAICSGFTATSVSEATHDIVWQAAEIGEEIPLAAAAFAGNVSEINEDDIAWALSEIREIEAK